MEIKECELISGMSNEDYHRQLERGKHYYSSSQLKDMLKDEELFYKKYITKELEEKERNANFDIGTYFHTAILEPHLLDKECTVWKGGKRQGKKWEEFKEQNEGKVIITQPELLKAERLIEGIENSEKCLDLIDNENSTYEESLFLKFMGVPCKIRTDINSLGKEYSFIADLKSTTGSVKDAWAIRNKVAGMGYDLSAAFYVDMVNEYIKRKGLDVAPVTDFWLIFATKDYPAAKAYRMTDKMMAVGRAKYRKALERIKFYENNNWKFKEETGDLDPLPWEASDWISEEENEEDEDLL